MRRRLCAILIALLGSLSLAVPVAQAAPTFSVTSIDPVVFYTTPGSSCPAQPLNNLNLPEATGRAVSTRWLRPWKPSRRRSRS